MSDLSFKTDLLRRQAEAHASCREWTQASACFKEILRQRPADADVLLQLSYVESLAGHYRQARDYALRADFTRTRDPAVVPELVARLRTFNEAAALHACIDQLRPFKKLSIPLLIVCAAQLSNLNQQHEALELIEEAGRGDPDYPPTLLARGQLLTYLGRFDEAEASLSRCLKIAPEIARTYWLLSRLKKQTTSENHIDAIRSQLKRSGRPGDDIALLEYALHKEFDDLGDYADAWSALESACRAKRATLSYTSQQSSDLVSALMAMPRRPGAALAEGQPTAIFIVGMHRSGTTLLEQLLEGSGKVRGLGELYDFTSQMRLATDHHCRGVIDRRVVERAVNVDFGTVGEGYVNGIAWRMRGEPFFTDKLPSNFLNIGFICQALPNARILHMSRDPVETCFSNLRELFSDANPYSYDQLELANFHRQYHRLMSHWHARWPHRILDIDYARLVAEPEATMRRVAEFCGLPFETGMIDTKDRKRAVATASAIAVRESVSIRDVPKWQPYADKLRPLIEALKQE